MNMDVFSCDSKPIAFIRIHKAFFSSLCWINLARHSRSVQQYIIINQDLCHSIGALAGRVVTGALVEILLFKIHWSRMQVWSASNAMTTLFQQGHSGFLLTHGNQRWMGSQFFCQEGPPAHISMCHQLSTM
jgi:hypothetical protein